AVRIHAEAAGSIEEGGEGFVEGEEGGLLAAPGGGVGVVKGDGGLTAASGTGEQRAGAGIDAAGEQVVELLQTAGAGFALEARLVFGGDEAREDAQAAATDDVVVKAFAKGGAAQFVNLDAAAPDAVVAADALHDDDAVSDALELEVVVAVGGAVVEQEDGDVAAGEVTLEGEDLAAVLEGIAGEHTELGEGVEDETMGLDFVDLLEDRGDGVGELDFRGMEDGVLGLGPEVVVGRDDLEDFEPIERPAVRQANLPEFFGGFGEGDIEDTLAAANAFEEELEGQGGFAGTWIALDEVEVAGREAAMEDVIQAGD